MQSLIGTFDVRKIFRHDDIHSSNQMKACSLKALRSEYSIAIFQSS